MFLSSCEKDEPIVEDETNEFLPVLDDNFEYVVEGNNVKFTTTINGNVWVTVNGVDHNFADKKVTVNLPNKGDYSFTCSSIGSGSILTSDPFTVKIDQDDLAFLDEGLWKSLSGGANQTKTWRMDWNADGELVYFDNPVQFSGADGAPYWSWDVLAEDLPVDVNGNEMTGFFNWQETPPAADFGSITFNATNKTVTTVNAHGEESSGSFDMNVETMKLTVNGVTIPIDTGRLNQGQFKEEDLMNLRLYSLTDSAMQIGVKRSFEGFQEDGVTPKVSEWVVVYNFIVVGYDYPEIPDEEFTFTEPLDTDLTSADLVGTWKLGGSPINWIGWHAEGNMGTTTEASVLNEWPDRAAFVEGWFGATADHLTAVDALEHEFKDDGSCTIGGISTTFSVSGGVVTFADSVGIVSFDGHWFGAISGTTFSVLDLETPEEGGIWIGVGAAPESKVAQIVKQ